MNNRLHRVLAVLTFCNLVCLSLQTVLSYGMTLVSFGFPISGLQAAVYSAWAEKTGGLGQQFAEYLRGESALARRGAFLLAELLPLVISSIVFVVILALLARYRADLTQQTARLLFIAATGFAAASLFAAPFVYPDFWLSVSWGRMVASGVNPYHNDLTAAAMQGVPLNHTGQRMTYGPLWAVASGLVMGLVRHQAILGAVLFKVVLAGAWVASLRLVWSLLEDEPLWNQCVGIAVFGWIPISVQQTVAEGHNDVLMVLCLLTWLYYLRRGTGVKATLALTASALAKYSTAPVFALDFLHSYFTQKQKLVSYALRGIAAGLLAALCFGLFYRSPAFFSSANTMRNWHFYEPGHALWAIEDLLHIPVGFAAKGFRLFFPLLAGYQTLRYCIRPTERSFRLAVLGVMSAILFSVVSHVWPWFVLWVLSLAALLPSSRLSRWVIGVALAATFTVVVRRAFPEVALDAHVNHASLGLYGFSVAWLLLAPNGWFPDSLESGPTRKES